LFLVITHNDSGTAAAETVVGSGWTLVNPPGPVNRINTVLGVVYEKISAAGSTADDVTVAMNAAIPATFQLVEFSDADAAIPSDVTGLNSGSAQTLPVTASTPTSRDDVTYLAVFASGHNDHAHSNPLPATSTIRDDHSTPGAASGAKLRTAIVTKAAGTHPETITMSVDVASGGGTPFNHNYIGLLIGIPGAAGALSNPGATFGLEDTNDGQVHRACRGDYYLYHFTLTGQTAAQATANAKKLAALIDLMVTNVGEVASTKKLSPEAYQGNAPAMHNAHPDQGGFGLRLGIYHKGYVWIGTQSSTGLPANYYAHTGSFPGGPIILAFGSNDYLAMPYWSGQSAYTDARGWTAHSSREQLARDAWEIVRQYNVVYGANTLKVVLLDSMNLYKTNIDPTTGANYVNPTPDFIEALGWTVGDEAMTRRLGASYLVLVNGMKSGPFYFPEGQNLLAHADGGVGEGWSRGNFDPPGTYESPANINQTMDMFWDANVNLGKIMWVTVNINNQVAGKNNNPPSWTSQQLYAERKRTIALYMIGKRTSSFFEFVETTDQTMPPWNEDHPYYHVDLGIPLENGRPSVVSLRAPMAGQTYGINQRNFTAGAVFYNRQNVAVTFQFDRDYKNVTGDGTAHYGAGTQFTMQPNTGMILLLDAPQIPNASAPATAWDAVMPTTSQTSAFVLSAQASDPDGIASGEFQLNGGPWLPAAFSGGLWQVGVALVSGANVALFRATDGNSSPLTSSPITITITYTPNAGPPSASFNNPPTSVTVASQLVQVTASDSDGIAGVTIAVNDSTAQQDMVYNTGTSKWELTVTLPLNVNTLYAVATDSHPEPQSRSITRVVTVTTIAPNTGTGGTPPPPVTTEIPAGSFAGYVYDDLAPMDF
jgi:hypothetical protein